MAKRRNPLTGTPIARSPFATSAPDAASTAAQVIGEGRKNRGRQNRQRVAAGERSARRGVSNAAPAPTNLRGEKVPYNRGKLASNQPKASTPSTSSGTATPTSSRPSTTRNTTSPAAAAVRKIASSVSSSSSNPAAKPSDHNASSSAPKKPAALKKGTIAYAAQKSGADFMDYGSNERNYALQRYKQLHPWTKGADQETVKKVVALLLKKKSKRYSYSQRGNTANATSSMGGPDTPPSGS